MRRSLCLMYRTLPSHFLVGMAAFIGVAAPLKAQERNQKVIDLQDFTVQGLKLERSLFDAQESVALISGETATIRGLFDLQDVLPQTANVYSLAGEAFGIRGIAHNSAATRGGEGETGSYYFDGVALTGFSKRFGPDGLWDVAQVEILRGPQSTNVGRNALAGAILVQTNDPTPSKEVSGRIKVAEYDSFTISGMANVPVSENSAFRFAANYLETDGFIENPTRNEDDYDAREELTLRSKYRWASEDERFSALFTLQYAETERGEDFILLEYADSSGDIFVQDPQDRQNLANLDAFETNESWLAALEINFDLNSSWSLFSLTSFLTADYGRFDDDDQLPFPEDAFRGRTATDENWSQEIRVIYDSGNGLRGVIGIFYTEVLLEIDTDSLVNVNPALVGVPGSLLPFYPPLLEIDAPSLVDNETTNAALFTEWEWELGDLVTLFAGARYDYEELDSYSEGSRALLNSLPDPATPGLPPEVAAGISMVNASITGLLFSSEESFTTEYEAFLPQVGIDFDWSETFSTGLMFKRGYRAGGVDVNSVGVRTEYDPEYLNNFEFSVRSLLFEQRVVLNLNAYYGLWEDQQVGVQVSEGTTVDVRTENAGESEIYGFEFELTALVIPNLQLFANLGYSHTEFREFASAEGDFAGNRFGFAPEWTGALGGTYTLLENWFVHGNVTYQGDSFTDPANEFELDSHTVVNVRFGYRSPRFTAAVFAKNLFDELYLVNRTENFVPTTKLGKVGDPRVIGAELGVRF